MIPFMPYWDDEEPGPSPHELDAAFGPTAVTFGTYQMAIQACLESMGSRVFPVPVIMPVTSSPQTLAGVLRSGAQPIILDIYKETLQLDPVLLAEILGELEDGAIIILNRPNGMPVEPALLKVCEGFPTIEEARILPMDAMPVSGCTFAIYDLSVIVGDGAVLYHAHADQLAAIKSVRNAPMGCSGALVGRNASFVLRQKNCVPVHYKEMKVALSEYLTRLPEYTDCDKILQNRTDFPSYVICATENSAMDVADLRFHGVEAMYAVFGLHNLPEIKERFLDLPEYPNADEMQKKLVALPLNAPRTVTKTWLEMKKAR